MRTSIALVLLLASGAIACHREQPAPKVISDAIPLPPAPWFDESKNATSLINGTIVVDRTGEADLSQSAIALIDTQESTMWATPPADFDQSILFELPVRTRIRKIAIADADVKAFARFREVEIEISDDGIAFRPLVTLSRKDAKSDLGGEFAPASGRFLRLRTTRAPIGGGTSGGAAELRTFGDPEETATLPDISGRWQLNNLTATFAQHGRHFSGVVDMNPPMQIEGTWFGSSARYLWMRNKQFGVGILSANRESKKLNALWWFEAAIPMFFGDAWFGDRTGAAPGAGASPDLWLQFLRRFGRTAVFGITFGPDGIAPDSSEAVTALAHLVQQNPKSRVRVRIREIRQADPGVNLSLAKSEAAALSNALRASGADLSRVSVEATSDGPTNLDMTSNIQRLIYSRVEVELVGEQR